MKKHIFLLTIFASLILGCTKDGETTLQPYNKIIFSEKFDDAKEDIPATPFNIPGWITFAQAGTKVWSEQQFRDTRYVEFSSFGSGQLVNIGWLISPQIDMDKQEGEVLTFEAAQSFLISRSNSLEILVSTNFDGTNVSAADWVLVPATIPVPETPRFTFISSGIIDLSKFKGKLNFAFRVKGSGTESTLRGTYQVDNILMFYKVQE